MGRQTLILFRMGRLEGVRGICQNWGSGRCSGLHRCAVIDRPMVTVAETYIMGTRKISRGVETSLYRGGIWYCETTAY